MQGMDFTTDKLRSLVRKWQTLIEAHVDVKTTDGYLLRLFCISFTMKRPGQIKKTCYAQSSQVSYAAILTGLLLSGQCNRGLVRASHTQSWDSGTSGA